MSVEIYEKTLIDNRKTGPAAKLPALSVHIRHCANRGALLISGKIPDLIYLVSYLAFYVIIAGAGPLRNPRMASSDSSLKDETKKIGQRLTEWFEAERASLRDLGLSIKGDDGREHYTELNAAELTSIIDESDPSMQLRPNLWEVSKERR